MTKSADPDKHFFSGYGNGFDLHGSFSLFDRGGFGKNVIIFGADMRSFVHMDNKKWYILIKQMTFVIQRQVLNKNIV